MLRQGTKIIFKNDITYNDILIPNGTYFVDESNTIHIVIIDNSNNAFCFENDSLQKILEDINTGEFEVSCDDNTIEELNSIRVNRIENNIVVQAINIK